MKEYTEGNKYTHILQHWVYIIKNVITKLEYLHQNQCVFILVMCNNITEYAKNITIKLPNNQSVAILLY